MQNQRLTVGYCRVSTVEQATDGVSLAAQEDRIRAFAAFGARELAEIVVDAGESAKTLRRPGIARVLEDVRAGQIACLIVYKLDRLTRSVRDLVAILDLLEKYKVCLVSICENFDTGTPVGQFTLHLLGAIGQLEVKQIAERTRFALAHKRQCGKLYGPVPFGFVQRGEDLVPQPQEQVALRTIIAMRRNGATLRHIAGWLGQNGFQPKRNGLKWHPATVRRLLGSLAAQQLVGEPGDE